MQPTIEQKRKQLLTFYALFLAQLQQDNKLTALEKRQQRRDAKQFIHKQYQQYLLQFQPIKETTRL